VLAWYKKRATEIMDYRPEIDGLRALAVLPVIFFHAGFQSFGGGYVGVDVFFVISGYLITTILLSEIEQGKFSLVTFYERRARRILPALFFMMFVSCITATIFLSPSHMKDFSQSLVAISLFSSNILFWKETGYWGGENELKPLLHTWSLAVEEQYYVLFPIFLILMWRFRKRWIFSSFFIFAFVSFFLSQYFSSKNPTANFFLLPTRGWELAIGSLIAFYFLYRPPTIASLMAKNIIDNTMAIFGTGLIVYAILVFDEKTPFPSAYALVPTMGAAFIIVFASKDTLVGKVLGSKPLVGIGLISYSAYLWHQPLFAYAKHVSLIHPSKMAFFTLSVLSLIFATLSWKFIESPFRNKAKISRKKIFILSIIFSVGFILFGVFGSLTNGMKFRFDPQYLDLITAAKTRSFGEHLCIKNVQKLESDFASQCVLAPGNNRYAFLYGDSHADALMREAKNAFKEAGVGLIFASKPACPPILGVYRRDQVDPIKCVEHNNRSFDFVLNNKSIDYVILTARWTLGIEGQRFNNLEGGIESGSSPHLDIISDDKYLYHKNYEHTESLTKAYINSISRFLEAGKKVILIYPVPEAGWNVPDYIFKAYIRSRSSINDINFASTAYSVFIDRNSKTIDTLDRVQSSEGLFRVLPEKLFCNSVVSGRCITHQNGTIYYRDDDHLSDAGARLLIQEVLKYIEEGD